MEQLKTWSVTDANGLSHVVSGTSVDISLSYNRVTFFNGDDPVASFAGLISFQQVVEAHPES